MSHASLTARYRPQTFAEVAGQETVKAILSRAAHEDRVAPAYLFSGTRGVGKTTIARIFAKALNCATAPTGEPCNVCEQCRKITQGMHVDVVEIDGASNRGIEDAKRLKEAIGYAPMEGRYKVFIIDEAHMLTREAFNALLKTLEEPPARVTFILATTEAHKFPITIISRCQHFSFKRLPEQGLEAHLTSVLEREGITYDHAAVRLIARRAAGSVRDSMSLLGQTLALGGEHLTVEGARSVLGLAGQELFLKVMESLAAQDCLAVSGVVRELLDRGVDIGFFLRELATMWRNLFMLRQAGEAALPALDLPEEEARLWLEWAPRFEITQIHACWQMTLEGQRRVLTSLEPAMALELLLLNLAMLPRLLPIDRLGRAGAPAPAGGQSAPTGAGNGGHGGPGAGGHGGPGAGSHGAAPGGGQGTRGAHAHGYAGAGAPARGGAATGGAGYNSAGPAPSQPGSFAPPWDTGDLPPQPAGGHGAASGRAGGSPPPDPGGAPETQRVPSGPPSWDGFLDYIASGNGQGGTGLITVLRQTRGTWENGVLTLAANATSLYERLTDNERLPLVETAARTYFGDAARVTVIPPTLIRKTEAELRTELSAHAAVQMLKDEMGAFFLKCTPLDDLRRVQQKTDQGEDTP